MRIFLAVVLLCSVMPCLAEDKVVNVFAWDGYFPQPVLNAFTKLTGIRVNLTEYDSNETLYAKLKANPHVGYDLIVPSSDFVGRMRRQGMLRQLNLSKLTRLNNLNPALLNKPFDPANHYSVPYLWGTTGITFDKRYWHAQHVQRWSDLWRPQFHNQLLLYNDTRDVFAMALIKLGYSVNDRNLQHIHQAYLALKKLMPNVRLFNTDAANDIYADGDITVGMAENGDVVVAQKYNADLVYIYPKDGFVIWVDSMAIPRYAPHYQNALRLINFILRPEIEKQIVLSIGYSTPNVAALTLLPKAYVNDPVKNPSNQILKRGQFESDTGPANQLYQRYWQLLKLP